LLRDCEIREVGEWDAKFIWMDPGDVRVDGQELHWQKISPETARQSFISVRRFFPFIYGQKIQTQAEIRSQREKLTKINLNNPRQINDQDLRFFDLYFGGSRILVERAGGRMSAINGRHRLFLAQQLGVKQLPVYYREKIAKTEGKEVPIMGSMDLESIEKEAGEQQQEADALKHQIEVHKDQVEKLEKSVQELKAAATEMASAEMTKALESAEKARQEAENRRKELTEKRDKLTKDNQAMTEKVQKAYEGRKKVMDKLGILEAVSGKASDEFKGQVAEAREAVHMDMNRLGRADMELNTARNKLEALDI
jgi:hypothetical protein